MWSIEWDDRALRSLRKLDHSTQTEILRFLSTRVAAPEDPRRFGKALRHEFKGLWRYRVGDHRIVCRIEDARLTVLVVALGHRSTIYR